MSERHAAGALLDRLAATRTARWLVALSFLVSVGLWVWEFPALLLAFTVALVSSAPGVVGALPGIWVRRGRRVTDAGRDLERRRPVWSALSELYLDTELDSHDHVRIAEALARSGYGRGELEEILYRELHPVLMTNLFSLAGVWGAFDLDWLERKILRRDRAQLGVAVVLGKWMVQRHWKHIWRLTDLFRQ